MTIGHIGIFDRGCIYCGHGGENKFWVDINGEWCYDCPNCHRLTPYNKESV